MRGKLSGRVQTVHMSKPIQVFQLLHSLYPFLPCTHPPSSPCYYRDRMYADIGCIPTRCANTQGKRLQRNHIYIFHAQHDLSQSIPGTQKLKTQDTSPMMVPMQSHYKLLHTRSEFLGIFPTSSALKDSVRCFGQAVDHGAKDMFRH